MKHHLYWLPALSALLILGFLGWAFSFQSTPGLFQVNGFFRMVFIVVGLFGLLLVCLTITLILVRRRFTRISVWFRLPLYLLAAAGMIVPLAAFIYLGGIPSAPAADIPPQVYIADVTGSGGIPDAAVVFFTEEPDTCTLAWGDEVTSRTIPEEGPTREHVFTLRDLEPGTEYWYRAGDDGEIYRFRTPGIENGTLHFAVGSDAHFGSGHSRNDLTARMLENIADPENGFDYMFLLGDLVEYGFVDGQWHEALRAVSAASATVPTRLAPGNHDTLFSGTRNFEYFGCPEGMGTRSGSRLWSRIDAGEVHFLLIDLEWNDECYTAEQAAWLEAQLKDIPEDEWKIVMGHGFYYASGSVMDGWAWYDNPDTIAALVPLFEEYGVDIVFSGHVHELEVLEESGVTYLICSGLGGLPDPEQEYISPASVWYASGEYAYIDVTIEGDEAGIVFRSPDNSELYSVTVAR